MLFQYLNCVCNIQSQHGIWEMLQHFLPNTETWIKVDWFFLLPSSSSEACIAEYVRIPSYKYEYVYTQWRIFLDIALSYVLHEASYWRLILIECLRYWLLHTLALSCRPRGWGGGGVHSVNNLGGLCVWEQSPAVRIPHVCQFSHIIIRIIRIPCKFIS